MDYYKEKQFIAQVDKKDKVIRNLEKWEAHKKGILHRGYTCILTFEDKIILQHRKHPVFDGVFDLSFSSHQLYTNGKLQSDEEAIYDGLKREWNLKKSDLKEKPQFIKKIYYKSKDPNSGYTEHEIDYIYIVELKNLPTPNYDFAYGFSLVDQKLITDYRLPFTPWVKVMLDEKVIK
ncbi:hypothetical protein A2954_06155 [Candidatus Roizmanbacteria bacterium RIFCSPLOWO2_01_FULL_37_12]|uniref:Nudix hydrolase domain-containing protein n=1 Tax=Candidatus Roizmanbacteria bacterium RIFCSPLOWO2_01_FULL_37_12 TaxID=1802056 RepID=A0A1F7ICK0_9BACT|nr:MAG: hypothetical protein A2768_01315 [Candidatus Roizmanbacteria bacterium RIFCSPHIGHO2_01_FULL_37_16]OGK24374.1 MAG: hypothetical protein A3D76_01785 [Candidatus Roizmanbacteria bacterium RIFCSPHIGHO2_02_FULL_37_9b]OGK41087.1 MAG: hypothetical protein A2954_06155 [Candidatus Roizmanbacteria bacterium RIFCSPLOWO2_01_FULL_37_12]